MTHEPECPCMECGGTYDAYNLAIDDAYVAARGECEHRFVMHYADKAGQCDKCGAIDTDLDVIAQHAQPADPSTHAAATAEQGGEQA